MSCLIEGKWESQTISKYLSNYTLSNTGTKRATRSTPVTENPTTTTVTNAQLQAMIDQGVTAALTARDANRNGDDSHTSGTDLRKKILTQYCSRNEIKNSRLSLEFERKGTDVTRVQPTFSRTHCLCVRKFPEESAQEISTFAERQAENKRKLDNNHQAQQQLPKRQNVVQAYAAVTGERKEYAGTLPLCNKCKFHHNGPCTVKCANCKRVGHLTRDCWSSAATNNQRTLTCYECGNQGHYKSDCPKLKNRNHGNQAEGTGTHGMVLALGGGETDQDPNNIEDEIEA
ncbi:DNA-directed DNA polymerase [Tanacetum coccineum]